MNEEIKEKTVILPPFRHFIMSVGEIPTSYLESMTYYEMLVWFTNYLGKTVIPAINENGEAVTELQNLFVQLQTYVNDYFDNLDVQEEINNKLDAMVEDGTLDQIINQEIFSQINSDISNLYQYTSLKEMPTLFIGDSYTNASTSYATIYKSRIGLPDAKFFKYAIGGAGWYAKGTGNKDFNDLLNDAIAGMTSAEKNSIKQIIVGCCVNDASYSSTRNQIKSGISTFMTSVATNFPNAKVYVIGCGYRIGYTSSEKNTRLLMDTVVIPTLMDCDTQYNQFCYIDNSHVWLRNNNWFNEDNIHPNNTGQNVIANHLIRALQGNTQVIYQNSNVTVTIPKDGSEDETFTITTEIIDNVCDFKFATAQRFYNIDSVAARTFTEIGTWASDILHPSSNTSLDIPVILRCYKSSSENYHLNGLLRLSPENKVYLIAYTETAITGIVNFMIYNFTLSRSLIGY